MIRSYQGIRVIAMLIIFLFHAGIIPNGIFSVTLFFILSGFFMYYKNFEKSCNTTFFQDLIWGIKKIKRLYPVHLITFLISIPIRYKWISNHTISEIVIMGISNLLLLQTLTPKYALSFNNLSWYLSVTLFCYMFSKSLIKLINKLKINEVTLIIYIWVTQIVLAIILPLFSENYNYIFYMSPYFRILDFYMGMLLCKKYLNRRVVPRNCTIIELCILVSFVIVYGVSFSLPSQFTRGIVYSPIFLIGIYYISYEKGFFSKILKNNVLIKLSKISFEFNMIHELVLIIFRRILYFEGMGWLKTNIIIAIPAFIVSYILAKVLSEINIKNVVT